MDFIDIAIEESERLRKKSYYYYLRGNLIKKRKPCFTGDKIHIRSREGIYTVTDVTARNISLTTSTGFFLLTDWDDFKCLAPLHGQGKSIHAELRRARRNLLEFEIIMLKELDRINNQLKGGY